MSERRIEEYELKAYEGDELGPWREAEPASWFYSVRGAPMIWSDPDGVTHACKGADTHDTRILVTMCEEMDVPANGAHCAARGELIDCPACLDRVARGEGDGAWAAGMPPVDAAVWAGVVAKLRVAKRRG